MSKCNDRKGPGGWVGREILKNTEGLAPFFSLHFLFPEVTYCEELFKEII